MPEQSKVQVAPEHKGLAFLLTKSYKEGMSAEALYEATRGVWRGVPKNDPSFLYAFAVHKNVVKEVYEIEQWEKAGTTPYTMVSHADVNLTSRWEFVGHIAPDSVRDLYVGKEIERPKGQGRPLVKVGG